MLVSAFLYAQHYERLQVLFHLLQNSRWSDIISVFELKKLSLERLNDLNKIAQLIRGKKPNSAFRVFITISYFPQK